MENILIIVDYQKDFYDPNGSLYVKGGEKLLPNILKIIPNFDWEWLQGFRFDPEFMQD